VGDTFVLNCLGEGSYAPIMKARAPFFDTAGHACLFVRTMVYQRESRGCISRESSAAALPAGRQSACGRLTTRHALGAQHFLQRFPPGADRFAGVETFTAGNGAPVLGAAVAHLECRVAARLETPDHWITYAHVTSGEVADATKKTAVHRRKVANYY